MKKTIVIGATSGIGYNLALILVNNGYSVAGAGRRIELLNELKTNYPYNIFPFLFDVRITHTINDTLQLMIDKLGGVDLIVYCSGAGDLNPALDYSKEQISIDVNVKGFTAIADFAYTYFQSQGYGHFLTISSIMGLRGNAIAPAYSASKAYQINYLEGLRQRANAQKSNIVITDVRPGSIRTDMMKGEGHFWVSTPEKASKQIFKAIRKQRKVVYVSNRWSIIAFLLKIFPRRLYAGMGKV